MVILGLDPGLARTGFGLVDTSLPAPLVRCGCLTTPAGHSLADRLLQLGQDLNTLLDDTKPNQVVVEEIFFGANVKTAFITAQARGVLLFVLRQHRLPVTSLTPLQIKSRLTGYGRATKKQIQRLLVARLKLTAAPQPDDAADAVAAALCLADQPNTLAK